MFGLKLRLISITVACKCLFYFITTLKIILSIVEIKILFKKHSYVLNSLSLNNIITLVNKKIWLKSIFEIICEIKIQCVIN